MAVEDQLSCRLDGDFYEKLSEQLSGDLDVRLNDQLYEKISDQLYEKFVWDLYEQLPGQLYDPLYDQLHWQLFVVRRRRSSRGVSLEDPHKGRRGGHE